MVLMLLIQFLVKSTPDRFYPKEASLIDWSFFFIKSCTLVSGGKNTKSTFSYSSGSEKSRRRLGPKMAPPRLLPGRIPAGSLTICSLRLSKLIVICQRYDKNKYFAFFCSILNFFVFICFFVF